METGRLLNFETMKEKVGRFRLQDETFLIPQMNRIGAHMLAVTFRGFGIRALVMDTCRDLSLGMKYTSGKECYPCQITMGDILYYLNEEKERLGHAFDPEKYLYFMPEAGGPCRFGMYNKYQRLVLDSIPGLEKIRIGSLSTEDGYSLEGMADRGRATALRKAGYFSVVVSDILDRLLWRVRPYEKEPGMADSFMEEVMREMEDSFEEHAAGGRFERITDKLTEIITRAKELIDRSIPPKPLIGIVGEIYLRTHVQSNQDTIRVLEKYGAEVVNASIAEWVNYTTYDGLRQAKRRFWLNLKQMKPLDVKDSLKKILAFEVDYRYQNHIHKRLYKSADSLMDIAKDHRISSLDRMLEEKNLFSFDIGTEACLSISGIMEYAKGGFNGVVNIYPFTCMPSTITSSIVRPVMNRLNIPYLDTPYDSSIQPGREAAIRTFMYQAAQHFARYGRGHGGGA